MIRWLLPLLAALLSACTTEPAALPGMSVLSQEGSTHEGQATIYVLRDEDSSATAWAVTVSLDGANEGSLKRATYAEFGAQEGEHVLRVSWPPLIGQPDVAVHGDFEAGRTYYFLFWTTSGFERMGGGRIIRSSSRLNQTTAADAVPRIHAYKLQAHSEPVADK